MTENEYDVKPQIKSAVILCRLLLALSLIPLGYFVLACFVEFSGKDVEWMITPAYYYITPIFGFIPVICLLIVAAKEKAIRYVISGLVVLLVNMGLLAFEYLLLLGYSC